MEQPLLEVKEVSKAFTGVQALDRVNMTVQKGEIHALIGENGAGKSTILKIVSGLYRADSGTILFKGEPVSFSHPIEARKKGIAMVYQELTILPHLTVAQNVYLNEEFQVFDKEKKRGLTNEKLMREKVKELADTYEIEVDPYAMAGDLPIAKQQMVEILKALVSDPDLIILDEPTSALGREEVDKLFQIVRNLQSAGKTIIFITHRLEEVFRFGSKATVFKDGKLVGDVELKDVTTDQLISMMVGRDIADIFPPKGVVDESQILFEAKNINSDVIKDVSFAIRKGEILSIAGLQGQGQSELFRILSGVTPGAKGEIHIHGEKVSLSNARHAIEAGIAYIPEDRKVQALFLGLNVRENLAAASLQMRSKGGFIKAKDEMDMTEENIKLLNIKTPTSEQYVVNLSGGNQQKVVVGKGLAVKPKVLIFNEPTRGIDVEAKQEIYRLLRKFADEGIAVLMYSSDMVEVVGLSDRILTMYEGAITGELTGDLINEEDIMRGSVGQLTKDQGGAA